MQFITAISRFILPAITLIIIIKCILTLWLGHPKEKTYGYIIDMLDGERYALNMWETSIGRSTSCDVTVNYDTIARTQAVFTRRIDGWYIYNITPRTDIKINGKKIEEKATARPPRDSVSRLPMTLYRRWVKRERKTEEICPLPKHSKEQPPSTILTEKIR